jgi:muconolactone delta-isomerase
MMEFLVHMEVGRIEVGPEAERVLREQEANRARELGETGLLRRLWRVPGPAGKLGHLARRRCGSFTRRFGIPSAVSVSEDYSSPSGVTPE